MMDNKEVENIVYQLANGGDGIIEHSKKISQIEQTLRKCGFYTTKEYPIFRMKDKPERTGRIDLVARKGKFRMALEYDHHKLVKWKSFQKIVQIRPDVAIAISGSGQLEPNVERGMKFKAIMRCPLYVISLAAKKYRLILPE